MRNMRWVAAALAAIVLIPYCLQLRQARNHSEPAATAASGPTAERGGSVPIPTRPNLTTPSTATPLALPPRVATSTTSPAPATATPAATATPTVTALPPPTSDQWSSGKFAGFSSDELADMATRCELRWQLPRTPTDRYQAAVRALYVELTGDDSGPSLRIMDDTLRVQSDDDALPVHKRLADRRAGAAVEPSGSVYERYLQLQLDESERAQRDGDEPGPKFTMTGCDSGSAIFRSGR